MHPEMAADLEKRFSQWRQRDIGDTLLKTGSLVMKQTDLTNRLWADIYWPLAQRYYASESDPRVENPLVYHWIDPEEITRWSGRPKAMMSRAEAFGTIRDGDWDRQSPDYEIWPPEFRDALVGDPWTDSDFYRSFELRYGEGVSWEETPWVETVLDLIADGETVWQWCETEEDVYDRCEVVDALYDSITESGYKTQHQLHREGDEVRYGNFRDILATELTVDIGRNGEYLFVDSKHRLAIAKLLDLDRIPAIVLCRHADLFGT